MTSEEKREELNKPPVKYVPVCEECQTQSVVVEGGAVWDTAKDDWVLEYLYETSRCTNVKCEAFKYGGDISIDWVLPEDVKPTPQETFDYSVERA